MSRCSGMLALCIGSSRWARTSSQRISIKSAYQVQLCAHKREKHNIDLQSSKTFFGDSSQECTNSVFVSEFLRTILKLFVWHSMIVLILKRRENQFRILRQNQNENYAHMFTLKTLK